MNYVLGKTFRNQYYRNIIENTGKYRKYYTIEILLSKIRKKRVH